jgi:hypothetical protein
MAMFAALAGLFSVLTSWFVGLRLVLLSRRSGQLPELLVGLALFLAGGCWSPLVAVGRQATALSDPARAALVVVGAVCGIAGMSSLALFNWRVYRPGAAWAAVLAAAIAVALAGVFVLQCLGIGWTQYARTEQGPWLLASWIGVAIYAWASFEAWRQYRMQLRRRALGLADPVVTDRMRLWGFAMGAALAGSATLATCQLLGIPVAGTVFGLVTSALIAAFAGACLLLAFVPPAAYLARVRRVAGAEG